MATRARQRSRPRAAAPRPGRAAARPARAATFRRVLIANRGEIALRVLRACRQMGISPVIVHSDADGDTLPVRLADAAFPIGAAPAASSYLDAGAILKAARASGADAIHPGYGFLAENADFARSCEEAGFVFIGPPPDAMRLVGDKVEARRRAAARGVPVIPGLTERVEGVESLRRFAASAGYPILLKAAAGGGGKGMRVVHRDEDLETAARAARSEARAAFGDDGIYAEKFLEGVRHVEVQVLADARGAAVHLGERECSVQRRHQKLIEEAPSVALDDRARARLGALALEVVRSAAYRNAGTVEFLLDRDGRAYFMEVNARIQVEHPVTEMVTGYDLVQAQIRIAAGGEIGVRQEQVAPRGWAIECRILAEDPAGGFAPSPGEISGLRFPHGPGVRVDSALRVGETISLHYDALVAKLIAWGRDRNEAIARMRGALDETVIAGVRTTLPYHREVLADPDFAAGRIDIAYGDRNQERFAAAIAAPGEDPRIAVIAAAISACMDETARLSVRAAPAGPGPWTLAGRRALHATRAPRPTGG